MLFGRDPPPAEDAAGIFSDALRGRTWPSDNSEAMDVAEVAEERERTSSSPSTGSFGESVSFRVEMFWMVTSTTLLLLPASPSGAGTSSIGGDIMDTTKILLIQCDEGGVLCFLYRKSNGWIVVY